jgi:hypothetical protein
MTALSERGPLPRQALEAAGRSREEMIPEFLAMIERLQRADVASVSDEDLSAFLFVFYLLGEWRDPRTYRPLLRLLRHEPELLDALLGDAITEGTGRVVAGVCDGDLLPIVEVVRDGDADSFVGAQMFDTLVVLALSEPLKQAPIVDFLRSFPDHTPYGTEAEIWSAWAFAIAALGLADMKPQVRKAYDDKWIPRHDSDFAFFEQCLEKTLKAGRPEWFERRRSARLIESAVEELAGWYCFSPEFLNQEPRRTGEIGDPAVFPADPVVAAMPKVGRNDPCPCGSGKKFKKCCLQ